MKNWFNSAKRELEHDIIFIMLLYFTEWNHIEWCDLYIWLTLFDISHSFISSVSQSREKKKRAIYVFHPLFNWHDFPFQEMKKFFAFLFLPLHSQFSDFV